MFKRFILILVLLAVFASPAQADTLSCHGVVVNAPIGLGLPVMFKPSYFSEFVGINLLGWTKINIIETFYSPNDGQIWFELDTGGWIQSYSGYSSGVTSTVFSDYGCEVKHSIGE